MKTTKKKIVMLVALCVCMCVESAGEIRSTKDLGNGIQLYQDSTSTKLSIDGGNTWITIAEREPVHYSSTPKRESKSDSADTLLATLRENGRATYIVKYGMGKRLGHDGKTLELMNLMQQKTLEMKSPKEVNYDNHIRYVYFDKMDLDKLAPALEEYRKSNAYKQNWYDFCAKPYGVFKITSPIVVMKCWKKDYDELVVDVEHPVTLKRGWLVDIDTLYGIRMSCEVNCK